MCANQLWFSNISEHEVTKMYWTTFAVILSLTLDQFWDTGFIDRLQNALLREADTLLSECSMSNLNIWGLRSCLSSRVCIKTQSHTWRTLSFCSVISVCFQEMMKGLNIAKTFLESNIYETRKRCCVCCSPQRNVCQRSGALCKASPSRWPASYL